VTNESVLRSAVRAAAFVLASAFTWPAWVSAAPAPPADFRLGFTAKGAVNGDLTADDASGVNSREAPACSVALKMVRPLDSSPGSLLVKPAVQPIRVVKRTSNSSLRFARAFTTGEELELTLNWYSVGSVVKLVRQARLKKAKVVELQTWQGSCDGSVAPDPGVTAEAIMFSFERIDWEQFDPPVSVTLVP
jgi:type VI secretion system Hcp family effector